MTDALDLIQLSTLLTARKTTSAALTESALAQAERAKPLNAFIQIHQERAPAQAVQADRVLGSDRKGTVGPLAGIPVAIKDNIDEAGVACAAGCKAYRDRVPDRDAEVVRLLRKAHAVIIGRTNMHELADGVTSENPHFGPVHNPFKAGYHPGGSSGGSAVAVAAGCVPAALGTDTGGSVRIPASLCGVVGFKPTRALVSTSGVVPLSTTLDHVGPLTRTVRDAALMLNVLCPGPDTDYLSACDTPPSSIRVGVLEGFAVEADSEVGRVFAAALGVLEKAGATLEPVRIPSLARSIKMLAAIYAPEAAQFHAERLKEAPEAFGEEVRKDLERGLRLDPQKKSSALGERVTLAAEVKDAFKNVDFLVCPTTPHPARPFGSPDPYTYLAFTCPFNLTGQPAVSIPMGRVSGLPVGLQLIGRTNLDAALFSAAALFEEKLK